MSVNCIGQDLLLLEVRDTSSLTQALAEEADQGQVEETTMVEETTDPIDQTATKEVELMVAETEMASEVEIEEHPTTTETVEEEKKTITESTIQRVACLHSVSMAMVETTVAKTSKEEMVINLTEEMVVMNNQTEEMEVTSQTEEMVVISQIEEMAVINLTEEMAVINKTEEMAVINHIEETSEMDKEVAIVMTTETIEMVEEDLQWVTTEEVEDLSEGTMRNKESFVKVFVSLVKPRAIFPRIVLRTPNLVVEEVQMKEDILTMITEYKLCVQHQSLHSSLNQSNLMCFSVFD